MVALERKRVECGAGLERQLELRWLASEAVVAAAVKPPGDWTWPDPATLEDWELSREMTVRIAWKPYMFNAALPHLLKNVRVPTLLAWGTDDRIVPVACRDQYLCAIPSAKSTMIDGAGHQADLEKPEALAAAVVAFVASSAINAATDHL